MSGLNPEGQDFTININEDESYPFSESDFGYSDAEGDPFSAIVINSLPESGTLTLNGNALGVGNTVSVSGFNNLVFTPASDANGIGYASFDFSVMNDTGDEPDSFPKTITFDLIALNDLPTSADNSFTVEEDGTHEFASAEFPFTDPDNGDALQYVKVVTLPESGTLYYGTDAATAGMEIAVADIHFLTFVPAPNINGTDYASFTFEVSDGTGYSQSAYKMTVNVSPTNDLPTTQNFTRDINEDGTYVFVLADFVFTDIDASDVLAMVRLSRNTTETGRFYLEGNEITFSDNSAYEVTALQIQNHLLIFVPDNNDHGDGYAVIEFTVGDGLAFSGEPNTMTFNVTPVNDAPSNVTITSTNVAEFRATNTLVGTLSTVDADPGSSFSYTLLNNAGGRFLIAGNQLRVNNGLLCDFEQDATHTVQVRATDNGGASFIKDFNLTLANVNPEVITGNSAANVFWGGALADNFNGAGGNDVLKGFNGNDVLNGGLGIDTLTGGLNNDIFVFNTALSSALNKDTITDFNVANDSIRMENAIFTKVIQASSAAGVPLLAKYYWESNTGAAHDADDRIIYNTLTGILTYDSNGNAAGGATQFAVLTGHPDISQADFLVI